MWVRGYRMLEQGAGSMWGWGLAVGLPGLGVQGWKGTPPRAESHTWGRALGAYRRQ